MRLLSTYSTFLIFSCTPKNIQANDEYSINLSLTKENDWKMSRGVFELINDYRNSKNKLQLKIDSSYASALAVKHSKYMMSNNIVNHNNFFWRKEILQEKGAIKIAENIAYGYTTPNTVVEAWLKSEEHVSVILGDYTHIGFGILTNANNNRKYYTTIYYK
ncbi:CAP domain-containing protein [Seonamhaeicola sp. ML3]|uniref:CAP domain-containing protein n=1 Tax=Seonamhaeicola sp. ML3 TaxID=2937786 RepID=UPI00200D15C5|nr:CAP domain-containing protein [Seonamhaeicola sp. ML3]